MRKKERSRIAVLLGIGAICGMLGTTGRYVICRKYDNCYCSY